MFDKSIKGWQKTISLGDFCVRGGTKIKMQPTHEGLGVCLNWLRGQHTKKSTVDHHATSTEHFEAVRNLEQILGNP